MSHVDDLDRRIAENRQRVREIVEKARITIESVRHQIDARRTTPRHFSTVPKNHPPSSIPPKR